MNTDALHKAARKLEKLSKALDAMKAAISPMEIEDAWDDFVLGTGSFYSTLEQGAKGAGQSMGWFGRKKHERKSDPLLRYLHHARNAEEHGIKRITKRVSSSVTLKSQGAGVKLSSDGKQWSVTGREGDIEFANDLVRLVRVHNDRHGDWTDPPNQHLGQPLVEVSPPAIAALAFAYLQRMLAEAKTLATG